MAAHEQVFLETFSIKWSCDRNHVFANGQLKTPVKCWLCGSRLVKPIIDARIEAQNTATYKPKTELSEAEGRFLARIA